jgi:hypothetical protein
VTIEARDNAFAPQTRSVAPGDRITWRNSGAVPHEVTATNGAFASGNIDPGKSYTWTATGSGTVSYYCRYHGTATSGMTGRLTIAAAGGGAAAPAPTDGHPRTGGGRQRDWGLLVLAAVAVAAVLLRRGRQGAEVAR